MEALFEASILFALQKMVSLLLTAHIKAIQSPNQSPPLELISRAAPSVEAHHLTQEEIQEEGR